MKEQYVGDIGDLGKVLILKHLADLGFRIGINWVLTANDNGNDGKHRDYVNYRGVNCLCCCNEGIFEKIVPLAKKEKADRRIGDLEALISSFSTNVVFYPKPENHFVDGPERRKRDDEAFEKLTPDSANLVFFDPDNGIREDNGRNAQYVYVSDLQRYWKRDQSLLIYHHLGKHKPHEKQIQEKVRLFENQFPGSLVFPYRLCRGTARVYLLCIQPHHAGKTLGKTTVPSIEPLRMTKNDWATTKNGGPKALRHCSKDHSEILA